MTQITSLSATIQTIKKFESNPEVENYLETFGDHKVLSSSNRNFRLNATLEEEDLLQELELAISYYTLLSTGIIIQNAEIQMAKKGMKITHLNDLPPYTHAIRCDGFILPFTP